MEYLVLLLVAATIGVFFWLLNRWVTTWLRNRQEIDLKDLDRKQMAQAIKLEERQMQVRINEAVEPEQVAVRKAELRLRAAELITKETLADQLVDDRVTAERKTIEADAAARVELAPEFARRRCDGELARAAMPGAKQLKQLNKLYESYLMAVDELESQTLVPLSFDQYVRAVTATASLAS